MGEKVDHGEIRLIWGMVGKRMARESPKKIRPRTAAITTEPVMMIKPRREIQMREEAFLAISGLPEEPMYSMPETITLIRAIKAPAKMAILMTLLRRWIRPEGSWVP